MVPTQVQLQRETSMPGINLPPNNPQGPCPQSSPPRLRQNAFAPPKPLRPCGLGLPPSSRRSGGDSHLPSYLPPHSSLTLAQQQQLLPTPGTDCKTNLDVSASSTGSSSIDSSPSAPHQRLDSLPSDIVHPLPEGGDDSMLDEIFGPSRIFGVSDERQDGGGWVEIMSLLDGSDDGQSDNKSVLPVLPHGSGVELGGVPRVMLQPAEQPAGPDPTPDSQGASIGVEMAEPARPLSALALNPSGLMLPKGDSGTASIGGIAVNWTERQIKWLRALQMSSMTRAASAQLLNGNPGDKNIAGRMLKEIHRRLDKASGRRGTVIRFDKQSNTYAIALTLPAPGTQPARAKVNLSNRERGLLEPLMTQIGHVSRGKPIASSQLVVWAQSEATWSRKTARNRLGRMLNHLADEGRLLRLGRNGSNRRYQIPSEQQEQQRRISLPVTKPVQKSSLPSPWSVGDLPSSHVPASPLFPLISLVPMTPMQGLDAYQTPQPLALTPDAQGVSTDVETAAPARPPELSFALNLSDQMATLGGHVEPRLTPQEMAVLGLMQDGKQHTMQELAKVATQATGRQIGPWSMIGVASRLNQGFRAALNGGDLLMSAGHGYRLNLVPKAAHDGPAPARSDMAALLPPSPRTSGLSTSQSSTLAMESRKRQRAAITKLPVQRLKKPRPLSAQALSPSELMLPKGDSGTARIGSIAVNWTERQIKWLRALQMGSMTREASAQLLNGNPGDKKIASDTLKKIHQQLHKASGCRGTVIRYDNLSNTYAIALTLPAPGTQPARAKVNLSNRERGLLEPLMTQIGHVSRGKPIAPSQLVVWAQSQATWSRKTTEVRLSRMLNHLADEGRLLRLGSNGSNRRYQIPSEQQEQQRRISLPVTKPVQKSSLPSPWSVGDLPSSHVPASPLFPLTSLAPLTPMTPMTPMQGLDAYQTPQPLALTSHPLMSAGPVRVPMDVVMDYMRTRTARHPLTLRQIRAGIGLGQHDKLFGALRQAVRDGLLTAQGDGWRRTYALPTGPSQG